MRIAYITARVLFILSLPLLLITASIAMAANSQWFYEYGFDKYEVGRTTGLAQTELDKAASGLISYFNSGEEYIDLVVTRDGKPFTLFNQREVVHLKDVKGLLQLDYHVLAGTLGYGLVFAGIALMRKDRRGLARSVFIVSGIAIGLMLALGLGTLLNFDRLLLQFHLISFTNELWLLDPSRDYLIMLFPQGFFYDFTLFCGGITVGLAVLLGGASRIYLKQRKQFQGA